MEWRGIVKKNIRKGRIMGFFIYKASVLLLPLTY